ncbi:MAG: hypothetical protein K4571_03310 [Deltaproteobacteria bacterium]
MSYFKWLMTTLSLLLISAVLIVTVNFIVDTHAIRLSLFNMAGNIRQDAYPEAINQHTFNPEFIFRNPEKFDSFLFGSSRVAVIDVTKIPSGRFYNMSYSEALPAQHLAILKTFLQKGIRIKTVVIGLDEFCFTLPATHHQKQLLRIMHPDVSGQNRLEFFAMYFFRKPTLWEVNTWRDRIFYHKNEKKFLLDDHGMNLGWLEKEKTVEETGLPIFDSAIREYKPIRFGAKETEEALDVIKAIVALSRIHHFTIVFFINPFYSRLYLNNAEAFSSVKARLAQVTDYYDFSGLNSVTTNAVNYYEESHYRYRVGDMIVLRLFGGNAKKPPDDFGVMVTRQNIGRHLENQKSELEDYLKTRHLQ